MRVSQGYWGTREHGQFQLGNRGTKTKYLREQGNKKRFREHGNKMLRKGGQKKNDVKGTHLATFLLHSCRQHFVSKSVCTELRQWFNWGISKSYEFTLGGWMLSEIINRLVGRSSTVVCEIAVTTYYILNMAQENLGRIEGFGRTT